MSDQLYNLVVYQMIGSILKDMIIEYKEPLTALLQNRIVLFIIIAYYTSFYVYKSYLFARISRFMKSDLVSYTLESTFYYGDHDVVYIEKGNYEITKAIFHYIFNELKININNKTQFFVSTKEYPKFKFDCIPDYLVFTDNNGEKLTMRYYNKKTDKKTEMKLSISAKTQEVISNLITISQKKYEKYMDSNIDTEYKNYIYITNSNDRSDYVSYWKYEYNNDNTFDKLFINEKEELMKHISDYKLGVSHHKFISLMLSGKPGTGKTSIIKMLANYFNRSVVYVKLSEIRNFKQLLSIIHDTKYEIDNVEGHNDYDMINVSNNKIIVFEDIDACCDITLKRDNVVSGDNKLSEIEKEDIKYYNNCAKNSNTTENRKYYRYLAKKIESKKTDKTALTLDDILNALNGVIPNNDVIFVMTTNYLELIDPALVRPGRITLNLKLNEINKATISNMIHYYYPEICKEEIFTDIKINNIIPCILENIIKNTSSYTEALNIINNDIELLKYNLKYIN